MEVITVCACTYRRPDLLLEMLHSFKALKTPPGTEVTVCIVDNDIDTSARAVVDSQSGNLPFSLKYVHEEQPGIPSARNRALEEAANSDFLVFVDDDEWVVSALVLLLKYLHQAGRIFSSTFFSTPTLLSEDCSTLTAQKSHTLVVPTISFIWLT